MRKLFICVLLLFQTTTSFGSETWSYMFDECEKSKVQDRWRFLSPVNIKLILEHGLTDKAKLPSRFSKLYEFEGNAYTCPVEVFGSYRVKGADIEFKIEGVDVKDIAEKCGISTNVQVGAENTYSFSTEGDLLKLYVGENVCDDKSDSMFEVYSLVPQDSM